MSAAPLLLPRVWAMTGSAPMHGALGGRKPPARLCLVSAASEPVKRPEPASPAPEVAFYRKYTEALLYRYMKLSMGAGRVPSLLGRELFRGDVSHCRARGFDDAVIFVHDVTGCIAQLRPAEQGLIRRIAMHGYSQSEAAAMLGISLSTVVRRYHEGLDRLTGILLQRGLLRLGGRDET